MWDDYHILLIATFVFTRVLIDKIYHPIELPFDWLIDDAMVVCLLDDLILGFCYSNLTRETDGFELASTNALVLQVKRLTKCEVYRNLLKLNCRPLAFTFYHLLFQKTKRDLELIFLPHFLHYFWRKIFFLWYSINWPNFIVWLPFLREMLGSMCIAAVF